MQILELFAGSCSFSNVAKARGHETITTDIIQNPEGTVDIVTDLFDFDYLDLDEIDFIWASPPCTTYSIASCSTHWTPPPDRQPKTEKARDNELLMWQTMAILQEFQPTYYLIENPRGLLRKMETFEHLPRTTVI